MNSSRRILLPLLVLLVMALGVACGHNNGGSDSRQGNVRVKLSAAPATTTAPATASGSTTVSPAMGTTGTYHDDDGGDGDAGSILSKLEHVNVTFSSLLARNLDGDLVDMTIALPATVDLIPVISGQKEVSLPIGTLPPGMYDQIVVVITQVEFVFLNGGKIALTPPGGGWTRIIAVEPFEVIDGQTTTIMLKLRTFDAFKELNGEFQFFPEFDCHHED